MTEPLPPIAAEAAAGPGPRIVPAARSGAAFAHRLQAAAPPRAVKEEMRR